MDEAPIIAAVICAAGLSSRMGGVKKEYQKLKKVSAVQRDDHHSEASSTVLETAVNAFLAVSCIKIIVITVSKDTEAVAREALSPEYLTAQNPKILFVNGGKTRRASVLNALLLLRDYNPRYVLIHDGARPWISPSLIENTIEAVKKHGAVIPLLPLTDTPKELEILNKKREINNEQLGSCDEQREDLETIVFIKYHLKRANVGIAQTPQAFLFPEILYAHEKAANTLLNNPDEEFTDDAEVWGRFNGKVAVIPGEPENKKITFPEDLNQ